jgi:hypothetical protein
MNRSINHPRTIFKLTQRSSAMEAIAPIWRLLDDTRPCYAVAVSVAAAFGATSPIGGCVTAKDRKHLTQLFLTMPPNGNSGLVGGRRPTWNEGLYRPGGGLLTARNRQWSISPG